MKLRLLYAAAFLLVIGLALLLRLPRLADRPLHNDEAVNTVKLDSLWSSGRFDYDPAEYHGPALYYATMPAVWITGASDFATTNEITYRIVPVFFGVWLIALTLLLRHALGRWAAFWAALLAAVSPGMVYYSRYYIHEYLLVAFTFAAIITGWRFTLRGRWRWAIATGINIGLMAATKETWIIHVGVAFAAIGLTWAWDKLRGDAGKDGAHARPARMLAGAGVAMAAFFAIIIAFFSNFFRDFFIEGASLADRFSGIVKFFQAYTGYLSRGAGHSTDHVHPFGWYIELLTWFQYRPRAPIFTEMLIVALALIGFIIALLLRTKRVTSKPHHSVTTHNALASSPEPQTLNPEPSTSSPHHSHHRRPTPSIPFIRFLAFYTLLLTLAYSILSYKTPWCVLSFLHAMTLLGGLAIARLIRLTPTYIGKSLVIAALLVGVGHLLWETDRANGLTEQWAKKRLSSSVYNPYVYGHTTSQIFDFVTRLEQVAAVSPKGYKTYIQVVGKDIWPLPFYLRRFPQVGYFAETPHALNASIIIGSDDLEDLLPDRRRESVALRPGVPLFAYYTPALWDRLVAKWQADSIKK